MTWDGAFNLSDLGGLPLTGGGVTDTGRVFRSGAPEWLTDVGWSQAAHAGLTTIVDLRNAPSETERLPHHPVIAPDARAPFFRVNAPTEDPDDAEFMKVCGPWLDHPRSYADNIAFYPQKIVEVFRAIADAPGAVLVHCAGGKDRTGMIVAMLLSHVGAEHDAIVADYEAAFRAANALMRADPAHYPRFASTDAELDEWMIERNAALCNWLIDLDVADYLRSAGLDEARINTLATRLQATEA